MESFENTPIYTLNFSKYFQEPKKPGFWYIEIDTKFIGEIWCIPRSQKKWLNAIPNPESQIFMNFHNYHIIMNFILCWK